MQTKINSFAMKLFSTFILFVLLASCYQQERDCKAFKTGSFTSETEIEGKKYTSSFVRNDSIQIETYEGKIDTFKVRWTNDCEYIIQNMIAEVSAIVENKIWKGTAGSGSMDGFFAIASDRADVNFVASPVTLTTSNIVEKLEATIDELPDSVLASSEKPLIYVSPKTARLYLRKMQSLGYLDTFYAGEVPMLFEGLQIVECAGMYNDAIWIAKKSNMFLGTSLLDADNEVSVLDMAKLDGSKNVRFIMNFSAGVTYGIGEDIAVYWVD